MAFSVRVTCTLALLFAALVGVRSSRPANGNIGLEVNRLGTCCCKMAQDGLHWEDCTNLVWCGRIGYKIYRHKESDEHCAKMKTRHEDTQKAGDELTAALDLANKGYSDVYGQPCKTPVAAEAAVAAAKKVQKIKDELMGLNLTYGEPGYPEELVQQSAELMELVNTKQKQGEVGMRWLWRAIGDSKEDMNGEHALKADTEKAIEKAAKSARGQGICSISLEVALSMSLELQRRSREEFDPNAFKSAMSDARKHLEHAYRQWGEKATIDAVVNKYRAQHEQLEQELIARTEFSEALTAASKPRTVTGSEPYPRPPDEESQRLLKAVASLKQLDSKFGNIAEYYASIYANNGEWYAEHVQLDDPSKPKPPAVVAENFDDDAGRCGVGQIRGIEHISRNNSLCEETAGQSSTARRSGQWCTVLCKAGYRAEPSKIMCDPDGMFSAWDSLHHRYVQSSIGVQCVEKSK